MADRNEYEALLIERFGPAAASVAELPNELAGDPGALRVWDRAEIVDVAWAVGRSLRQHHDWECQCQACRAMRRGRRLIRRAALPLTRGRAA